MSTFATRAAFAASSLERTEGNLHEFGEGWVAGLNAWPDDPTHSDAWKVGRRAGQVYSGAVPALETR